MLWESGPVFLVLTVILGGGAAMLLGRAIALTWRPFWLLFWFTFLLSLGVRFLHFALFQGTLVSVHYLVVDYLVLVAAAYAGWRLKRTNQMVTQYRWLYEKTSPFTWRLREGADDSGLAGNPRP